MAFILGSNHRPVTESLALTESRPGVFSSGFVYHVQQSDLTVEQQEAIFKKELRIDNSKKESCVSLFSFIHSGYFYCASSSPLLLIDTADYSIV